MRISDLSSDVCSSDLDNSEDSGHLQAHCRSPVMGFFERHVELGQHVDEGELLGRIVDELGEQAWELRAPNPGVVLVLRAFSRALEIGRAAGRATVCQYVYISVVAVALKKKSKQ